MHIQVLVQISICGASIIWGVPPKWSKSMVYKGKSRKILWTWMISGYLHFRKPPYHTCINHQWIKLMMNPFPVSEIPAYTPCCYLKVFNIILGYPSFRLQLPPKKKHQTNLRPLVWPVFGPIPNRWVGDLPPLRSRGRWHVDLDHCDDGGHPRGRCRSDAGHEKGRWIGSQILWGYKM